jgi:glyoxylase-like metal-dependent hydrolase (beta-lactamase superfamily II)/rhodanese-related sulfurtransferase
MKVEQIYTGCLAQGAYYIESNGEAAIIDPLREVQPYIDMAEERGAKIKYVFETHFHADFVSGHIDLAKKTGATIVIGPTGLTPGYEVLIAEDNQEFKLGDITLRLLHTPGHTTESMCLLLIDESGKETSLFSGDTLFIGDVGRPDLAQKVIAELTQEKLASMLYDSLRNKIMPLSDDLIVYPGHGAGSACGKNLSSETTDTLGNQKKTNYALNPDLTREEFIQEVLSGLMPPPGYFPHNVLMNIGGYDSIDDVVNHGTQALSVTEFEALAESGVQILDTRSADDFSAGFIPGSYNIGIKGSFANWVGVIFQDVKTPLLLVVDEGTEEEVAIRLARIGFDNAKGFLKGGVEQWLKEGRVIAKIDNVEPEKMAELDASEIVDVRKKSEFDSEHIVGAMNAPLDYWDSQLDKIDKNRTMYVHCAGGYRSMVFCSILKAKGYDKLVNVRGGFSKIKNVAGVNVSEYVCPTTML